MPDRSLSIVDSTAFLVPTLAKSIAAARQLASAPDPVGLSERKMPRRLTRSREHLPARKASAQPSIANQLWLGIQPATGDPMTSDTGIAAMKLLVAFARSSSMNQWLR